MTRKRDRIFALFGAILFLVTASTVTIAVIINGLTNKSNDSSASQATSQPCIDNLTEQALPVPDVYKTSDKVTTLQKTDLQPGSGPGAKSGDCLIVKYYGTLATSGTKFDENFTTTTAFPFRVGQGQVIPGWDQGLIGMQAGGMRRLVIPASLAYGAQGQGSIPPNSDLVFVVKLLRIE